MKHFSFLRWWHLHVALLLALVAGLILGISGALTTQHYLARGGYKPGPLPPPMMIAGGVTPASISLDRYVVRLHDQGASNSCVAQTVSTMLEVETAEFSAAHSTYARSNAHYRAGMWMSPGYLYDQAGGASGGPILYSAAFGVAEGQGDSNYAAFPLDGITDYWVQPGPAAHAAAAYHRIASWRQIYNWDSATMRVELANGRPLAVALPADSSFVNMWGYGSMPVVSSEGGAFEFWHSVTAVGYTPAGLEVLNSWPGWGFRQRAILTWGFLQAVGAAVVIADPVFPAVPPPPRPVFPIRLWDSWTWLHHRPLVASTYAGGLSLVARAWWTHNPKSAGGVIDRGAWAPRGPSGHDGFYRQDFQGETIYVWPYHAAWGGKIVRNRWTR